MKKDLARNDDRNAVMMRIVKMNGNGKKGDVEMTRLVGSARRKKKGYVTDLEYYKVTH